MPDLSLFVPLCTLLGITLNELFAGDCIAEENWKEKADEVLMEVITHWLGNDNGNQRNVMGHPQMSWKWKMFPNGMKMFRQGVKQKIILF